MVSVDSFWTSSDRLCPSRDWALWNIIWGFSTWSCFSYVTTLNFPISVWHCVFCLLFDFDRCVGWGPSYWIWSSSIFLIFVLRRSAPHRRCPPYDGETQIIFSDFPNFSCSGDCPFPLQEIAKKTASTHLQHFQSYRSSLPRWHDWWLDSAVPNYSYRPTVNYRLTYCQRVSTLGYSDCPNMHICSNRTSYSESSPYLANSS